MKFALVFAFAALAQAPRTPPSSSPQSTTPAGPHTTLPVAPQTATPVAPQSATPSTSETAPAAPLPPWDETLAEGLAEVRKLARSNQLDAASALCERLLAPGEFARWRERLEAEGGWKRALTRALDPALDALGLSGTTAPERAEVLYAAGLVSVEGEQRTRGEDEFGRAQALAGPGELRLVSGFQLGTTALLEGETWRAQIPEIQAKSGAAPGAPAHAQPPTPRPSAPNASGAPGEPEAPPDPLAQARAAYLRARERFVERLRADWRDADTRANTELVQRRLKELDEIEQQRKEQEQQDQKNDKQDPNSKDKQDPNAKPKPDDKSEPPKDPQQDPQQKPDQDKPDEPKPDEQKPDDAQKQDPQKPDEKQDGEQPDPSKMEERQLTKEEMTRLLDLLEQRDEQWKKLQQQLQSARRARAKKDW